MSTLLFASNETTVVEFEGRAYDVRFVIDIQNGEIRYQQTYRKVVFERYI